MFRSCGGCSKTWRGAGFLAGLAGCCRLEQACPQPPPPSITPALAPLGSHFPWPLLLGLCCSVPAVPAPPAHPPTSPADPPRLSRLRMLEEISLVPCDVLPEQPRLRLQIMACFTKHHIPVLTFLPCSKNWSSLKSEHPGPGTNLARVGSHSSVRVFLHLLFGCCAG